MFTKVNIDMCLTASQGIGWIRAEQAQGPEARTRPNGISELRGDAPATQNAPITGRIGKEEKESRWSGVKKSHP